MSDISAEKSREAMGRILSVIGMCVSITGTGLLLSVNPQFKAVRQRGFAALPQGTKKQMMVAAGIGGLLVLGVGLYIRKKARESVS